VKSFQVSIEKAQELSRQLKIPYLECSAKGEAKLKNKSRVDSTKVSFHSQCGSTSIKLSTSSCVLFENSSFPSVRSTSKTTTSGRARNVAASYKFTQVINFIPKKPSDQHLLHAAIKVCIVDQEMFKVSSSYPNVHIELECA
jgi:hypothetical protein